MMAETSSKNERFSTIPVTTSPTYTTTTTPKNSSGISLQLQYFKTGPGIIKLIELFVGVVCMACAAPAWTNGTHWFLFVVVTAFVSTALWCFIYLLNLKTAINLPIDWLLTELLNTAITTLLYLIAVIVQLTSYSSLASGRNIAAGIFGFFNLFAYAVGSFFLYRDWKDSHPHNTFVAPVLKRNP